jgi:hypothetical protein
MNNIMRAINEKIKNGSLSRPVEPKKPRKISILKNVGKGSAALGFLLTMSGGGIAGLPLLGGGAASYLTGERIEMKYEEKFKKYEKDLEEYGKSMYNYSKSLDRYM